MGKYFVILSFILLAAHAVRAGDGGLAVFMIGCAGMALTRQRWAAVVTSAVLGCGAIFWLDKGADLITLRINTGEDWGRLAFILSILFGLTLFSAAYPLSGNGWKRFSRGSERGGLQAAVFLLSALLLEITRSKVSFPILLADRFFPGWGRAEIFLLALYGSWIAGKMYTPEGARKIRPRIWALFSAVFFTQFFLGIAGFDELLMTGELHLPVPALIAAGPVFRGSGFFMPILFTVSILLIGPAWCSHLCYIGAWDDQCSRLGGRKAPQQMDSWLIWLRLILLLLVVGAALVMRYNGASGYTAACLAAAFGMLGIIVMIYFSRRMGLMVHCTAFCPMGILSNLMGRLSPWRMRFSSDCCKCFKCSRSCRYNALTKADIEAGRPGISCTLCGDCIASCSSKALGYKLPFLDFQRSRVIFLVLVLSLHVLFIGVARI